MGMFESSGHKRNPIGFLSVLVGAVGAASSVVMWTYQVNPDSSLIQSFAARLGSGSPLGDRLVVLSLVCGGLAAAVAVVSSIGGQAKAATVAAAAMAAVALSYPVLSALNLITRPLTRGAFP